jgi:uncharacterized membrane protein YcaP (DUF421 family)
MDPIVPLDPVRMLIGDVPGLFYAEIVLRSVVIYAYTLVLLRWIGGRSIAQLSLVEFLLVIALGSAVGDAMFYPQVPLLHALAVITVVVLISKGIDVATLRWRRLNTMIDGAPVLVVADGVLQMPGLKARAMSTAEIASALRIDGFGNLGAIRRAYIEPSGHLSVFAAETRRPGLRIEPPAALEPHPPARPDQAACCGTCGWCAPDRAPDACPNCGDRAWTPAT